MQDDDFAAAAAAAAAIAAEEAMASVGLPPCPLPDSVIVSMLRREALLTKAKLHYLVFEHLQQDKAVRTLKSQLKQVCVCGGGKGGGHCKAQDASRQLLCIQSCLLCFPKP